MRHLLGIVYIGIIIFIISCSKKNIPNTSSEGAYAHSSHNVPSSQEKKKIQKSSLDIKGSTKKHKPLTPRQIRKEELKKSKPEFSDPMYFGHKKPPKKRKRGKQRLCKVCNMKH